MTDILRDMKHRATDPFDGSQCLDVIRIHEAQGCVEGDCTVLELARMVMSEFGRANRERNRAQTAESHLRALKSWMQADARIMQEAGYRLGYKVRDWILEL